MFTSDCIDIFSQNWQLRMLAFNDQFYGIFNVEVNSHSTISVRTNKNIECYTFDNNRNNRLFDYFIIFINVSWRDHKLANNELNCILIFLCLVCVLELVTAASCRTALGKLSFYLHLLLFLLK